MALFHFYMEGSVNISGGSVNIYWEITCQDGRCPDDSGRKLRRGWATISLRKRGERAGGRHHPATQSHDPRNRSHEDHPDHHRD